MRPEFIRSHNPGNSESVPITQADVARSAAQAGIKITVGAASAASAVLGSGTRAVRVVSTTNCWVEISSNPTAVADTSFYLPAGVVEYFAATPTDKVAAIQATAGGFLYLRPVN